MAQTPVVILTKEQQAVLALLAKEKTLAQRFYLTGGTALSAFYLFHRYSEDIDLFTEKEFDIQPLRVFVKRIAKAVGATSIDYQNFLGLHTFFFRFPKKEALKVDFNYYPFGRIEKGMAQKGVWIDSVLDIAVNKVHTMVMKPRARDYIDIYFIIKKYGFSLHELIKFAKIKFDWHIDAPQLGASFMQALNVKDFPRMIQSIDKHEWQDFFLKEAKQLEKKIFE